MADRLTEIRARLHTAAHPDFGPDAYTSEGKSVVIRALAKDIEYLLSLSDGSAVADPHRHDEGCVSIGGHVSDVQALRNALGKMVDWHERGDMECHVADFAADLDQARNVLFAFPVRAAVGPEVASEAEGGR